MIALTTSAKAVLLQLAAGQRRVERSQRIEWAWTEEQKRAHTLLQIRMRANKLAPLPAPFREQA